MAIRIVRLGSPRAPGEGLRIGTVRRPPRGVPKAQFASRDFYDVWLPTVAPSQHAMRVQQRQARFNAGNAVGNMAERNLLAVGFLALGRVEIEGRVVG